MLRLRGKVAIALAQVLGEDPVLGGKVKEGSLRPLEPRRPESRISVALDQADLEQQVHGFLDNGVVAV